MEMNVIILMAGVGKRFKDVGFDKIKPLIDINGTPMIELAVRTLGLKGKYTFIINRMNGYVEELISSIRKVCPEANIIEIDGLTDGPASTALLAKDHIDQDVPLIITNCDQIMDWDSEDFMGHIMTCDSDGVVVTYKSDTDKNSYILIDDNGVGIKLAEKRVISTHSLNGIHYWKRASTFFDSAEKLVDSNERTNNEFYIAPTYNVLINMGLKITIYEITADQHWPVGTPDDLKKYIDHVNKKN